MRNLNFVSVNNAQGAYYGEYGTLIFCIHGSVGHSFSCTLAKSAQTCLLTILSHRNPL